MSAGRRWSAGPSPTTSSHHLLPTWLASTYPCTASGPALLRMRDSVLPCSSETLPVVRVVVTPPTSPASRTSTSSPWCTSRCAVASPVRLAPTTSTSQLVPASHGSVADRGAVACHRVVMG